MNGEHDDREEYAGHGAFPGQGPGGEGAVSGRSQSQTGDAADVGNGTLPDERLREQVDLIREVFLYAHRFSGRIFVIHIADAILDAPSMVGLVKDLVLLRRAGIRIVLVAGAKRRIDEVLRRYGVAWRVESGFRVATAEAMPFVKMAAFDVANQLMTQLSAFGANAVIGNWVRARSIGVHDGIDYEHAGEVESIKLDLLYRSLDDDAIPIFPCIGWNAQGHPYNLSSHDMATQLSIEIAAEKLFFVGAAPGITAHEFALPPGLEINADGRVARLTVQEGREFLRMNPASRQPEVVQLVDHACRAGEASVSRIHIVDGRMDGVILKEIFSSVGVGTMIYANVYLSIRPMRLSDVPEVFRIVEPLVQTGHLIARTEEDLAANYGDYFVYEMDESIHGCVALHPLGDGAGELAALAVDRAFEELGIARKLVDFIKEEAARQGYSRLVALTTRASDWFLKQGFVPGSINDLPPMKRHRYDFGRRSRIFVFNVSDVDSAAENRAVTD
jgi:amino-acid N-acetyltransferase